MPTKFAFSTHINNKSSIFKNKAAMKPNYKLRSLDEILHRDDEINQYMIYMLDVFTGVSPNNLFIYGKPGLGKTLITDLLLDQLVCEAGARGIEAWVVKINCDETKTESAIMAEIMRQLPTPPGEEKRNVRNGLSYFNLYCKELINAYPGIIIVVFDELDKSEKPEVVNRLIRITSETSGQTPTIIGITNDLNLRDRFPPHAKSVLCENHIFIDPYDAIQIGDILRARVGIAFQPEVVEDVAIQVCAGLAAQEWGDARKAIEMLRVAGEIAEEREDNKVTEEDVREAVDRLETDRILKAVNKLPLQSKTTLLACIKVAGSGRENDTNTIYSVYKRLTEHVGLEALTLRRVNDLLNELDFLGIIEMEKKSRGRHGMSRKITKINSKKQIIDNMVDDPRFHEAVEMPLSVFAQMLTC